MPSSYQSYSTAALLLDAIIWCRVQIHLLHIATQVQTEGRTRTTETRPRGFWDEDAFMGLVGFPNDRINGLLRGYDARAIDYMDRMNLDSHPTAPDPH